MVVVVSHPVQYFSPLFDLLHQRGVVELTVVYGNDAGARKTWDPGFGRELQWDLDLLGGHRHVFLTTGERRVLSAGALRQLARQVREADVVVVHGYTKPVAVAAIMAAYVLRRPFVLRADTSHRSPRRRFDPRHWWPRAVGRFSAGALTIGSRNDAVMAELGFSTRRRAPFAVDLDRFRRAAGQIRSNPGSVRREFGVPDGARVIAFAGKFTDVKRPADAIAAVQDLPGRVHLMLVGDGPRRPELELMAAGASVTFTGFLNQTAVPRALAVADVLVLPSSYEPWGLVVNEAMAAGCVPVVSSAVGCAPDLVDGLGEVYPTGDVDALAAALGRALERAASPGVQAELVARLLDHGLDSCAAGYESLLAEVAGVCP